MYNDYRKNERGVLLMFTITVSDGQRKFTWNITCESFCEARVVAIRKHKDTFHTKWAEVVAISHYYKRGYAL